MAGELIEVTGADTVGFDYSIRLSRRRTASIEVKDGSVTVAAPLRSSTDELHQWVEQKASWIRQKLELHRRRLAQIPVRHYCHGESLPYLDRLLYIQVLGRGRRYTQRVEGRLKLILSNRSRREDSEQIRMQVQEWYKLEALKLLGAKTRNLAQSLGLAMGEVGLRQTRSKWGHCTREGDIQYNWLILQAPEWVVDYLVAHEVCHLRHLNHSARYWKMLGGVCPHYREAERWLKDLGHTLVL